MQLLMRGYAAKASLTYILQRIKRMSFLVVFLSALLLCRNAFSIRLAWCGSHGSKTPDYQIKPESMSMDCLLFVARSEKNCWKSFISFLEEKKLILCWCGGGLISRGAMSRLRAPCQWELGLSHVRRVSLHTLESLFPPLSSWMVRTKI